MGIVMELAKVFKFEASHVLPKHPGKCSNFHGHSWKLTVLYEGPIDFTTGMVIDYGEIKEKVQPLIDDLDHAHLGSWDTPRMMLCSKPGEAPLKFVPWLPSFEPGWNPTSEMLLLEIGCELLRRDFRFSRMWLEETDTACCCVDRSEVLAYKERFGK